MPRKRSIFAGGTDYTGVSLDDILSHLEIWRRNTDQTILTLLRCREEVVTNASKIAAPDEVKGYVDFFVDLFDRYRDDFDRLLTELPGGVRQRHVEIVEQISRSRDFKERRCVSFKEEFVHRALPNEDMRPLLDEIYGESREQLIDYRDLSNLVVRLRTFIGTQDETLSNDEKSLFEIKPNVHGIGIDLKVLWKKFSGWLRKRISR